MTTMPNTTLEIRTIEEMSRFATRPTRTSALGWESVLVLLALSGRVAQV